MRLRREALYLTADIAADDKAPTAEVSTGRAHLRRSSDGEGYPPTNQYVGASKLVPNSLFVSS